jgi:multiple inositol-polyphosphate phosphatase / 2,3-bisphosphoglycerate 3-phosphatase
LQLRDEVINNYRKSNTKPDRGALCEEDLALLELWQWDRNVTESYDEFLTTQGWEDLKFLARNYQRIFPNVLQNIYDQGNFLVSLATYEGTSDSIVNGSHFLV